MFELAGRVAGVERGHRVAVEVRSQHGRERVRLALRVVVLRYEQVIACSGGCHVQEACPLGRDVRLLALALLGVTGRRQLHALAPGAQQWSGVVEQHLGRHRDRTRGETAEDHDRELQTLGAVHREDAHGIVVELGRGHLDRAGVLVGLAPRPLDESAQGRAVARAVPRPRVFE